MNLHPNWSMRLLFAVLLPILLGPSSRLLAHPHAQAPKKRSQKAEPANPTAKPDPKPDPDQPMWDPLRTERSIVAGQFYLKKGNYDAAIDRFEEAALYHPGYALPYKFLGQAQEKKGLKADAVKSFEKYLDLYPHAEDAEKIRRHIAKLWQELDRQKKKSRSS